MTRAVVAVLAAVFVGMALSFYNLRDVELPGWWVWFLLTGVMLAVLAVRPSHNLAIVAGSFAFLAPLTRAAGVAYNMGVADRYVSVWSGVLGMLLWPTFAAALLYGFNHGIVPWSRQAAATRCAAGRCRDGRRAHRAR